MRFGAAELGDLAALLRDGRAAEIMPRFRKLGAGDVRQKSGPLDLVTEADEAAERLITAGCARRFPGSRRGRRGGGLGRSVAPRRCSAMPTWPSSSIRWTAPPISPPACRCSASWRRRLCAARSWPRRSTIRSATTPRWRSAAKAPGPKRRTGAGRTCVWRRRCRSAQMTGNVSWRFLPEPQRGTVCANLPRLARQLGLSLCRARIPDGLRRPLPSAVLQPADAMGPCAGLAAASGGGRLFGPARRQPLHAAPQPMAA